MTPNGEVHPAPHAIVSVKMIEMSPTQFLQIESGTSTQEGRKKKPHTSMSCTHICRVFILPVLPKCKVRHESIRFKDQLAIWK